MNQETTDELISKVQSLIDYALALENEYTDEIARCPGSR